MGFLDYLAVTAGGKHMSVLPEPLNYKRKGNGSLPGKPGRSDEFILKKQKTKLKCLDYPIRNAD